jgi:hypothetical protein
MKPIVGAAIKNVVEIWNNLLCSFPLQALGDQPA